jgi:NAD(P)-dependent dehydrogenase (short-subunit alcohol dehydrogenase family)
MSRLAVVTGGSQGAGLEICSQLLHAGWKVAAIARSSESLNEAKAKLGSGFHVFSADVRNFSVLEKTFTAIKENLGPIQLLINNAAVFKMKPFAEFSAEEIDNIIDTNLKGTIFTTLHALKNMKEGARIVNIASVAATHGIPKQAVYCASKFGMDGFAEALGQELVQRKIFVTTICPGGIDTPLWNPSNPYPGGSTEPLLKPADIANAVKYVAQLPKNVILKNMTLFPENEWH